MRGKLIEDCGTTSCSNQLPVKSSDSSSNNNNNNNKNNNNNNNNNNKNDNDNNKNNNDNNNNYINNNLNSNNENDNKNNNKIIKNNVKIIIPIITLIIISVMIKIEMSNNHNTLGKDKIDIYNYTIMISPTIQNEENRKKNTSSGKNI